MIRTAPGLGVVGEQDPPAGQRLRVGRVARRAAGRPRAASPSSRTRRSRTAGDLADKDAAVGERRVAVHGAERARRVVVADVRLPDLADDPPVADEEDPAVVGVGDGQRPVGQHVRVVGPVEVRRVVADDARHAEEVLDAVRLDVDREDVLVVLLVRDQRLAAGLTNVSSSKTRCTPRARVGQVGKRQRMRWCESTRRSRSLPRSAMRIAPGSGPWAVMTRFGFGFGFCGGRRRGRAAAAALGERAEKRDRRRARRGRWRGATGTSVTLAVAV